MDTIVLIILIFIFIIAILFYGIRENFGYSQDVPTYQQEEELETERPSDFETASDMPGATVDDVDPNLYML